MSLPDSAGGFAFAASAVEAVEALTIVLAVGVVRGWRSTLVGVGAATAVLAAIVALVAGAGALTLTDSHSVEEPAMA